MGIIRAVSGVLALVLIASCSVQKRAANKVDWVDEKHPITLVRWCASNVPVRSDTQYIPGKEIITPGVIRYVDCDTILKSDSGSVVSIPCPPTTSRVDTFRVTTVDSSQVVIALHLADSFKNQHIIAQQDLAQAKGTKKTLTWLAIIEGVVIIALGIILGLTLKSKIL